MVEGGLNPDRTGGAPTFKVVVIYDDLRAGQRAMHTFWSLVAGLPDQTEPLQPQLWRFDLLDYPHRFAWALAHSADADLLLLSVSKEGDLPPTADYWLEQWLAGKHGKRAGLVALLGPADEMDGPESTRFQLVQAAARKAGIDFFAPLPEEKKASAPPVEEIHPPEQEVSASSRPRLAHVAEIPPSAVKP